VKIVIIRHVYRNLKETGVFCFGAWICVIGVWLCLSTTLQLYRVINVFISVLYTWLL